MARQAAVTVLDDYAFRWWYLVITTQKRGLHKKPRTQFIFLDFLPSCLFFSSYSIPIFTACSYDLFRAAVDNFYSKNHTVVMVPIVIVDHYTGVEKQTHSPRIATPRKYIYRSRMFWDLFLCQCACTSYTRVFTSHHNSTLSHTSQSKTNRLYFGWPTTLGDKP